MRNVTHLILVMLYLFISCTKDKAQTQATATGSDTEFLKYIASKDSSFRFAEWSPVKEEKTEFHGLKYFPYNPELVFSGPIILYEKPDSVEIYATRAGDIRPALKYGYFEFSFKDETHRLQVYKMSAKRDPAMVFLFLGFTDLTTGKQTYPAGRYIDLEENDDNFYTVDFNYAYNPYCAYNEKYSCALPPEENRLSFAVIAGEKIYKEH